MVFKRFLSLVVPDTADVRLVFTATISGPNVTAGNNMGLWGVSPAGVVSLLLRTGNSIDANGTTLKVRMFDALNAPTANQGQGRSTDENGHVTAIVKVVDANGMTRTGVLRIPLP